MNALEFDSFLRMWFAVIMSGAAGLIAVVVCVGVYETFFKKSQKKLDKILG